MTDSYGQCICKCNVVYSNVSPNAARAREQPIATVWSALNWSTSFGFTSYFVSHCLTGHVGLP